MYIQITTVCNMLCEHCCYACTTQGNHMSMATFKKALAICDEECLSIGGGEPTMHPKFWEMIGVALGSCGYVWLATNGKMTGTALRLAELAKRGVISVALSQDPWHESIDEKVVNAFTSDKNNNPYGRSNNDCREIRNVSRHGSNPTLAGRCDWGEEGCVCGDIMVLPDGTVRACGCDDAPIFGNVNTKFNIPDMWIAGECWKYEDNKDALELEQYA